MCESVHAGQKKKHVAYQAPMSFTEKGMHISCEQFWNGLDIERFKQLVQADYGYFLFLDGIPAALKSGGGGKGNEYNKPIPLGHVSDSQFYVYNHLHFEI